MLERAPRVFLQPYEAKKMAGWLRSLGPEFKSASNALIGYAAVGMTPSATAAWEALRSLPEPVKCELERRWGYR